MDSSSDLLPDETQPLISGLHFSYQWRLFAVVMLAVWTLVGCFATYQYIRERRFKAELLDAKLQTVNSAILSLYADGQKVDSASIAELTSDMHHLSSGELRDLRVTLIDFDGAVIYDNAVDHLSGANHLRRPEVVKAMEKGAAYTIERFSESDNREYFYSAMYSREAPIGRQPGAVIRTAVPYSVDLREFLAADDSFIWTILGIAVAVSFISFFAAGRIGRTIVRLKRFSEKAERGERIYGTEPFPSDELGSISANIVSLYARLLQASADRDAEHRDALRQQSENQRLKRELTNNINHELKTPVAAMRLVLETLDAHPDLPAEKRQEFIGRCCRESERLSSLLQDVSTITRIDDAPQMIAREPLKLLPLVEEQVQEAQLLSGANAFSFHVNIPADIAVMGNPQLLTSVFRNLLSNAVSYSGGTEIHIAAQEVGPDKVAVEFADNGTGVTPEHLPHLFERFYRIDKGRSRKAGGTGLGLAIVKNAVMVHGGSIAVANASPHGLRFTFTLSKN